MARHIACLTFDFDLWSGFAARGMCTPTPISRGEFGLIGARRILSLLKAHDIRATWFVPGVVIDSHEADCALIPDHGHEVGHHGYSHLVPSSMSAEREKQELIRAMESIRRIYGRNPRGYRSPAWDLSPVTIPYLLELGFDYDSSMMGNDHTPYFARTGDIVRPDAPISLGETTRLVEMPISWSLDDHPHFEFYRTPDFLMPGLANADAVLGNWVSDFLYMTRSTDWGVLTFTFHPYVIGRGHRMIMLEKLIDSLKDMNAVFMRVNEARDEFMKRVASTPPGKGA